MEKFFIIINNKIVSNLLNLFNFYQIKLMLQVSNQLKHRKRKINKMTKNKMMKKIKQK